MINASTLGDGLLFGLPLPELWFGLLFVIFGTFLFLDGFDFGAGAVFATLDNETERETVFSAIGPFWDGNEVWLVVFGGALFASFPSVYADLFSRHYLLMFAILGSLILRGLAPEMYEQRHDERWQRWWGASFVAGSVSAPFLLGVFAGNWLIGADRSLTLVGAVVGITVVFLTVVSGAAFLRLKAKEQLPGQVSDYGIGAVVGYLVAVVVTLALLVVRLPDGLDTILSVPVVALIVASVVLASGYVVAIRRGAYLAALAASGGLTYGLVAVVAVVMYPLVDPAVGATVRGSIVSTLPLNLMSVGAAILLPLVVTYFVVLYTAFRGPVEPGGTY
jgi:cytochrome d ubiquinol oxidase subunit II